WQAFESMKHENVALGPKKAAIHTSVKPQSGVLQVAFGSNVPPVIRPRRYPLNLPWTPASTVDPCLPFLLHAPGLWPASVRNLPRSYRVRGYEPSLLRPTVK